MEVLDVELHEFPDSEAGVVEHRDDRQVAVSEVREELVRLCGGPQVAHLSGLEPGRRASVGIRIFDGPCLARFISALLLEGWDRWNL